jgi:hypothetical protein
MNADNAAKSQSPYLLRNQFGTINPFFLKLKEITADQE